MPPATFDQLLVVTKITFVLIEFSLNTVVEGGTNTAENTSPRYSQTFERKQWKGQLVFVVESATVFEPCGNRLQKDEPIKRIKNVRKCDKKSD